ncbi:MAG: DUF2232 domain-containing protein, partial [Bacillota bacterium]|nr:DUF2232 domain-containing protein [Bacillota bacterium]
CYLLSSAVLRRQGYQIPRMPAFLTWHIDWRFSWGLILGLLFMFLARFFPYSWMESLGSVLSLCFGLVLALCGLSFLLWTMKTLRFPGLLRFCLVAFLLIFLNVGVFILAFLAVLDDMKSLRSRIIEKAHSREE